MTDCMCSFARSFNNKKYECGKIKDVFFYCFFLFFSPQTWTTTFLSFCRPPMRPRFPKERRWVRLWLRCQPLIWTLVCTGWWETSELVVNDILLPILFLLQLHLSVLFRSTMWSWRMKVGTLSSSASTPTVGSSSLEPLLTVSRKLRI